MLIFYVILRWWLVILSHGRLSILSNDIHPIIYFILFSHPTFDMTIDGLCLLKINIDQIINSHKLLRMSKKFEKHTKPKHAKKEFDRKSGYWTCQPNHSSSFHCGISSITHLFLLGLIGTKRIFHKTINIKLSNRNMLDQHECVYMFLDWMVSRKSILLKALVIRSQMRLSC